MRRFLMLMALLAAAGCDLAPAPTQAVLQARHDFRTVVAAVEPVAEAVCRSQAGGVNCDFLILVDPDPRAEPNAYQSVDRRGRPVILFSVALIDSTRSADELAFVLSHETSHHILGHLDRQARHAAVGAEIFGDLATLDGASPAAVVRAREIGAEVGARSYSKDFELEADQLGTVIAYRAGFDPLRGAGYFTRLPDPGDRFLGTHPPNAARIWVVRETVKLLQTTGVAG
ncbi:MAG: M48 family metallopeptidase [Antarcticimicrobium sp.]|uniref:M48 family metallopeptidase n=1 Tax=Antarcticimicrobium sp. TaxID=2824147 RepID=UPI00261C9121|nr:M48 family metallopeptidase [Antarcticimicrobium sp.]MDF1716689.1 M48 family metallopeptidase [Antarcticimicrobium sp.]